MWLKGVTISTTDESNGNMSLTLLLLPGSKKQRLPGLFFPPPDGISLDPCSAEPWACSTGLGWCSLRNCSGFLSLVVQSCHRLQELKTSTSQSPCPSSHLSLCTPRPPLIPLCPVVMDLLHPPHPCRSRDPPEPETGGRNWDLASRKPKQKQKAPPCKVVWTPGCCTLQHSTTSFHSTLISLSPGFHVKMNF